MKLHGSVGPARTTVSGVAEEAGVQRATVYRHFPDEASLFAACSAHYWARHPLPDIESWKGIRDRGERLRRGIWPSSTSSIEANEAMLEKTGHDAHLVPPWTLRARPSWDSSDAARRMIMKGRPERGAARRRTSAAVSHALLFATWQSLTRTQGLSNAEAVAVDGCDGRRRRIGSAPLAPATPEAGYVPGSLRVIPNRQGGQSAREPVLHQPLFDGGNPMTDQDTTQSMPAADPPPEPQPDRPRRLVRSRSDRMLGGVAGGLGDYFRVDPVIFRIGFGGDAVLRRARRAPLPRAHDLRAVASRRMARRARRSDVRSRRASIRARDRRTDRDVLHGPRRGVGRGNGKRGRRRDHRDPDRRGAGRRRVQRAAPAG